MPITPYPQVELQQRVEENLAERFPGRVITQVADDSIDPRAVDTISTTIKWTITSKLLIMKAVHAIDINDKGTEVIWCRAKE